MKKLLSFAELCAYVLGTIGGVGYACYSHAYLIAAAIVALGAMAFPEAKRAFEELTK